MLFSLMSLMEKPVHRKRAFLSLSKTVSRTAVSNAHFQTNHWLMSSLRFSLQFLFVCRSCQCTEVPSWALKTPLKLSQFGVLLKCHLLALIRHSCCKEEVLCHSASRQPELTFHSVSLILFIILLRLPFSLSSHFPSCHFTFFVSQEMD